MPQFVNPAQAAALCLRFPHIPITQVAERQGSGKITLNKSGSSGTRVWQTPWFLYPAFCDWLLGRAAVNPFGRPQLHRPDVFSPCYPWLYCQEASVEGEDLLGVDLSLRAFYRRAIVTAKYQPLELNNSIHINSQMLTIPNTQFIFIGQNPTNLAGFQQIFGVEMVGRASGGTFTLGFANDSGAATFLVPPVAGGGGVVAPVAPGGAVPPANEATHTAPLKCNASAAEVRNAVRTAVGLTTPTTQPGAVVVSGPEGRPGATGPWIITLNIPEVKTITANGDDLTALPAGIGLEEPVGAGIVHKKFGANSDQEATAWWNENATDPATVTLFRLYWAARNPTGSFRFKLTFADGTVNHSHEVEAMSAQPFQLAQAIYSAVRAFRDDAPTGATPNKDMAKPFTAEGFHGDKYGAIYNDQPIYMSLPFKDGADIPRKEGAMVEANAYPTIAEMATDDPYHPIIFYFGFRGLVSEMVSCTLLWTGVGPTGPGATAKPSLKLTKYDPYLANRLDQNVGKVIPMGEITIQRHQVIATDMVYLLAVVGSVNMFTFQGFPPWTLLLSGIDAKQTRLPNGTPCFDMTFKFAFNPYTHQAIFRPLYMRWEFVRGVLVARLPKSVAVPVNPLDKDNSRAVVNPKAVDKAWVVPKKTPRAIPVVIDPRTGKPVAGGPGGLAGGAPPAGGGDYGGGGDFGGGDYGGGGDFGGMNPDMPLGVGVVSNNVNPNPVSPSGQNGTTQGQVDVPFGTQPAATVEGDTQRIVGNLANPYPADPNTAGYNPHDSWQQASDSLGDFIAKSIGVGGGQADFDQEAAASGIVADIEKAREEGAEWLETYENGVTIDEFEGGSSTGGMEGDLAMARAAHECGAKLTPRTRAFLGLPPEEPPAGGLLGQKLGDAGSGGDFGAPSDAATSAAKAVNVGAAKSVQQMSTRIFDLGLIYPICDFTPILWMQ